MGKKYKQTNCVSQKISISKKSKSVRQDCDKLLQQYQLNPQKKAKNDFQKLQQVLSQQFMPSKIPCRQIQQLKIKQFLKQTLLTGYSTEVLFIAGVPGIGKTLTVKNALKQLQKQSNFKKDQHIIIYQNGMQIKYAHQIFKSILKKIAGLRKNPSQAQRILSIFRQFILDQYFQTGRHKQMKVHPKAIKILIIDQMDMLQTNDNQVIYTIVQWLKYRKSGLAIIGISNTIDLPESFSTKIQSRFGHQRLIFPPYTSNQIKSILNNRLEKYKQVFQQNALQNICGFLAGHQTDIRLCLKILRQSINKHLNSIPYLNKKRVEIKHISLNTVKQVIRQRYQDSFVDQWPNFPNHYKIVLFAMANYFRREYQDLILSQLESILSLGTNYNTVHQLRSILYDLRDLGLISIKYKFVEGKDRRVNQVFSIKKNVEQQHLHLLVSLDKIFYAKQIDQRESQQINFFDQLTARFNNGNY